MKDSDMNKDSDSEEHCGKAKITSFQKHILAAICFILLVIVSLTIAILRWEPKPDPESERIIREVAARQLNKDPNELSDEDFTRITMEIDLSEQELSDIKLLEKFTNIKELRLEHIIFPDKRIPKWMKLLAKLGIINLNEKFSLDLKPLENLSNLKFLDLLGTQVTDLKPIKGLVNLEKLWIADIKMTTIEPLKGLSNLQGLWITGIAISDLTPIKESIKLQTLIVDNTKISDLEPIKGLKNLQILDIRGTQVTDLRPLMRLTNLERLLIDNTNVSDLSPLKYLTNLTRLFVRNCHNITDKEIDDLQKALPNLKITR